MTVFKDVKSLCEMFYMFLNSNSQFQHLSGQGQAVVWDQHHSTENHGCMYELSEQGCLWSSRIFTTEYLLGNNTPLSPGEAIIRSKTHFPSIKCSVAFLPNWVLANYNPTVF